MFGDVSPLEVIMSLGPLWTFAPGHQDAHELFHVVLSALQTESQPTNRVNIKRLATFIFNFSKMLVQILKLC